VGLSERLEPKDTIPISIVERSFLTQINKPCLSLENGIKNENLRKSALGKNDFK